MKRRTLNSTEVMVVDHIEKTISANEAKEATVVLPWMTAFFAARFVTLITATEIDVAAFRDERAKTRSASSTARLVTIVKAIFAALFGARLRDDNPASDLKPPAYTRGFVDFEIDDALVRELLDRQRLITRRAPNLTVFVQTRRLAILSFSAAGAFCSEISTLDYVDVGLTLAAREHVRVGRSTANERELLLGGDGLSAIDDYIALRRSMPAVSDEALFVSSRLPFARLPSRLISDQISLAIEATGMGGRGLSPATVHRSVAGSALKAGHGGRVAASAGGYNLLPFSKPVAASAEEMSDLIERHHPMNGIPLT